MIIGKRVILRPIVEEDWALRFKWLSDPEINATLPSGNGLPLTPNTIRERTRKYAASIMKVSTSQLLVKMQC